MGRARRRRRAAVRGDPRPHPRRPSPRRSPPSSGRWPGTRRSLARWADEAARVRRLPLGVHGPRRPARATSTTTTASCASWTPTAACSRTTSTRGPTATTWARPSSPGPTSSRRTGSDLGYPDGVYRVGPLARVIVADQMGTPRADDRARRVPRAAGRVPTSSFHYHYARLIDILHCLEKIEELLRGARHPLAPGPGRSRGSTATRASACPRRPAARCSTTTASTTTASSSGRTWSSPPATTTWP